MAILLAIWAVCFLSTTISHGAWGIAEVAQVVIPKNDSHVPIPCVGLLPDQRPSLLYWFIGDTWEIAKDSLVFRYSDPNVGQNLSANVRYSLSHDFGLVIGKLDTTDSGRYWCRVAGEENPEAVDVTVFVRDLLPGPVIWWATSERPISKVDVMKHRILNCSVNNVYPNPDLTWSFIGCRTTANQSMELFTSNQQSTYTVFAKTYDVTKKAYFGALDLKANDICEFECVAKGVAIRNGSSSTAVEIFAKAQQPESKSPNIAFIFAFIVLALILIICFIALMYFMFFKMRHALLPQRRVVTYEKQEERQPTGTPDEKMGLFTDSESNDMEDITGLVQQSYGQRSNLNDPCSKLQLTMNTSVLEEGKPVRFFCRSERCSSSTKIFYIDDEDQTSIVMKFQDTVSLDMIPTRSQSGSLLECKMYADDGGFLTSSVNLTMNIQYPPDTVSMTTKSGICGGTECNMTIVLWRSYSFTCQSLSSGQACGFRWAITSKDGLDMVVLEPSQESSFVSAPDGGWNTESKVTLRAEDNYNEKRLVCSVLYPGNETYEDITVNLVVDRGILILLSVMAASALAVFLCGVIVYFACQTLKSKWSPDRDVIAPSRASVRSKPRLSKKFSVSLENLPKTKPLRESFPREQIKMMNVLGEGSFGVVYMAKANGILEKGKTHTVAVKMLKASVSSNDVSGFMKELDVCTTLEQHPHVIQLLGSCTDKEPFCLIFEFAANGNLQSFLRGKRKTWTASSPCVLTSDLILKFAYQTASGMEYLSSMQIIHRDLATRNILLTEDLSCKLSDFGFSRDVLFENQYEMTSNGNVPIRWMAIESIVQNKYTTMSDVWSYGVLLWEIFTLGSHPYPGMDVANVIRALQDGLRLPKPSHCSDKLYDLMKSCWSPEPSDRPDFFKLLELTQSMQCFAPSFLQMSEFVPDRYE